jgi:hypothetical protein
MRLSLSVSLFGAQEAAFSIWRCCRATHDDHEKKRKHKARRPYKCIQLGAPKYDDGDAGGDVVYFFLYLAREPAYFSQPREVVCSYGRPGVAEPIIAALASDQSHAFAVDFFARFFKQ